MIIYLRLKQCLIDSSQKFILLNNNVKPVNTRTSSNPISSIEPSVPILNVLLYIYRFWGLIVHNYLFIEEMWKKCNECQSPYKWFKILTQITKLQLLIYVYYDQ